jgi:hypothetical protein
LWDNSANARQSRLYNTALTSYEGKWIYVVGTYNGDESDADAGIKIYINGERVDDTNDSSGSYTAMEDKGGVVSIGANLSQSKFANGCTTEVSIWGTELSEAEVNELYNDGKALDATTHSEKTNLKGYWRNNGLATWTNVHNPGTHDGSPTSLIETMLITAGADGSRDSQGFIMNRQKTTNSLNLATHTIADGIGNGERVNVPGRIDLGTSDFSVSFWAYKFQDWHGQWIIGQFVDDNNRWYIRADEGNPPNFHIFCKQSGNNVLDSTDTTDLDNASYIEN